MGISSELLEHRCGYINGRWIDSATGGRLSVANPATAESLTEVALMGQDDVDAAIQAANNALCLAQPHSLQARRAWLTAIAEALQANQDEIGRILCLEHGKPLKEAKGEVAYAKSFFDYFAGQIELLAPRTLEQNPSDCRWQVHYRPVGVAALITPWNFPIAMIAKKLSAALAAGCPVVIKPASETPLTMIALFHLLDRLPELPAGMVNLVLGKASMIGQRVCEHPDVAMISFTGSTRVGQQLIRDSANGMKKLALELGGNAPFVVFEDADLDQAAAQLTANKFRGGGQTCVCANRILVQATVADEFAGKLVDRISKLKVGNGLQDDTDIGPLINQDGFDKVRRHTADALKQGARLLAGPDPDALDEASLFYPPTLIDGVSKQMACFREETFGPLVAMLRFDDEAQALAMANDTDAGLAAYFFTADDQRAARFAAGLRFGHVGHNTATGPTAEAPFGGMKSSGIGREGGHEGLFEFTEAQTIPRPIAS